MIEGLSRALLVVNAGSSSVKFSVFAIGTGDTRLASLYRGEVHGLGAHPHFVARDANDARLVDQAMGPAATHDDALGAIFEWIETRAMGTEVLAAGHRVVHGASNTRRPFGSRPACSRSSRRLFRWPLCISPTTWRRSDPS